jgi:hypothetical protein
MTFAGIPNEKQRADVIAYLNSNSDKPEPLPKAAENKPAENKAEGGNPPADAKNPPASPAPGGPPPAK